MGRRAAHWGVQGGTPMFCTWSRSLVPANPMSIDWSVTLKLVFDFHVTPPSAASSEWLGGRSDVAWTS